MNQVYLNKVILLLSQRTNKFSLDGIFFIGCIHATEKSLNLIFLDLQNSFLTFTYVYVYVRVTRFEYLITKK